MWLSLTANFIVLLWHDSVKLFLLLSLRLPSPSHVNVLGGRERSATWSAATLSSNHKFTWQHFTLCLFCLALTTQHLAFHLKSNDLCAIASNYLTSSDEADVQWIQKVFHILFFGLLKLLKWKPIKIKHVYCHLILTFGRACACFLSLNFLYHWLTLQQAQYV